MPTTDALFVDPNTGTPYTDLPVADGDAGTAAPVGTGARGWLRSLYNRLADGSQKTRLTNGTTDAGVTAAGALQVDKPRYTLGSPTVVTSSGNQTLYTPTAGKTPVLKWIYITAPDDSSANDLVVKWRTAAGADLATIYNVDLTSPGVFANSGNRIAPAADARLVISQSGNRTIRVNIAMEEE